MAEPADIELRAARSEDRDAVYAFTARTWGDDGDYIPYVWDRWLTDPNGAIIVAALEGRAVGMVHVQMLSATEAWLEGIRVDPALRRRGVGRALTARALDISRERGAQVARMFIDGDNIASQQMASGLGFTRIAAFAMFYAPAAGTDEEPEVLPAGFTLRTPGPADLPRLWSFLQASNLVPLNGGLIVQAWRARALTAGILEQRLDAGEIHTLEAWDAIQALAIVHANSSAERGPHLTVQYLDGAAEGIGRLALALRQFASREGLDEVRIILPDEVLILKDAMDGARFSRREDDSASEDHPTWCYARTL